MRRSPSGDYDSRLRSDSTKHEKLKSRNTILIDLEVVYVRHRFLRIGNDVEWSSKHTESGLHPVTFGETHPILSSWITFMTLT